MSSFIPTDIAFDILLNLPVKSLIRFSAVCKSWRSIIASPEFAFSRHLSNSRANEQSLLRFNMKHGFIERLTLVNDGKKKKKKLVQHFPIISKLTNPLVVGSSNGWVCLLDRLLTGEKIILWNPSIRKHIILPPPTAEIEFSVFGFHASNRDTKVVRIPLVGNYSKEDENGVEVEIYSYKLGHWRRQRFPLGYMIFHDPSPSTSLEGTLHWVASYRNTNEPNLFILAFHMDDEVFQEIMLPDDLVSLDHVGDFSITRVGESLGAMLRHGDSFSCSVWVMKDYGVAKSWTKLYFLDLSTEIFELFGFTKNGEVLFGSSEKKVLTCDPKTMVIKDSGDYYDFKQFSGYIYDYHESLFMLTSENLVSDENFQANTII